VKIGEVVAKRLMEQAVDNGGPLRWVPAPMVEVIVREAMVALAYCAPDSLEACEVDAAEVVECEGPRCHQLIDPAHPYDAKDTADGWFCGACLVDGGP
jgi:hypothetical protein